MKIPLIISFIFILLFPITMEEHISDYSDSPGKKKRTSTIHLFNGSDLSGWYTYLQESGKNSDPKKVFTVKDKIIRISGEEWGCITTNDEYENYTLLVEFKWGGGTCEPRLDKARDSGVLLHSVGEDGASSGIWMQSIECQVIEGGTGDFIVVGDGSENFSISSPVSAEKQGGSYIFKPDGNLFTINERRINWYDRDPDWKDVKGFRGKNDVEKPVGEWNKLKCVVQDGEISNYLNGILVNRAVNVKPGKGRIQIQSEGAEILFRKIDILIDSKN